MKAELARRVRARPARPVTSEENAALERAVGLSLTPQERLDRLERKVAELLTLRGLAARGNPSREVDSAGPERQG